VFHFSANKKKKEEEEEEEEEWVHSGESSKAQNP
jgi:hypothetical protein